MALDWAGLLDRKYANLEMGTRAEADYKGVMGGVAQQQEQSEAGLRAAQAKESMERAKTIGPTAAASIAATQAGIGQTMAQTGLTNAQTGQIGFNTTDPASDDEWRQYYRGINTGNGFGLGAGDAPSGFVTGGVGSSTLNPVSGSMSADRIDPNDPRNKIRPVGGIGAAGGATEVQDPHAANDGTANGTHVGGGAPVTGLMTLHDVMRHAMNSLHAAGGATTVLPTPAPAPGQTTTNGSWNPADLGGNTPNPNGQNQSLRRGLGMGVKAAGGATAINAKGGTPQVPGKGAPNVDSVPATLAPQEAVLNAGAAHHLGRGTIAALNALGAAKMAQAGMPPATPPTAHGVPMGRGMPPKAAAKGPAKGAPPAKAHGKPAAGKPPVAKKAAGK